MNILGRSLLENFNKTLKRENFEPVSDEAMRQDLPIGTICSVLREAYEKTEKEDVKYLLRLATAMAKRMSSKLLQYQKEKYERKAFS